MKADEGLDTDRSSEIIQIITTVFFDQNPPLTYKYFWRTKNKLETVCDVCFWNFTHTAYSNCVGGYHDASDRICYSLKKFLVLFCDKSFVKKHDLSFCYLVYLIYANNTSGGQPDVHKNRFHTGNGYFIGTFIHIIVLRNYHLFSWCAFVIAARVLTAEIKAS